MKSQPFSIMFALCKMWDVGVCVSFSDSFCFEFIMTNEIDFFAGVYCGVVVAVYCYCCILPVFVFISIDSVVQTYSYWCQFFFLLKLTSHSYGCLLHHIVMAFVHFSHLKLDIVSCILCNPNKKKKHKNWVKKTAETNRWAQKKILENEKCGCWIAVSEALPIKYYKWCLLEFVRGLCIRDTIWNVCSSTMKQTYFLISCVLISNANKWIFSSFLLLAQRDSLSAFYCCYLFVDSLSLQFTFPYENHFHLIVFNSMFTGSSFNVLFSAFSFWWEF